VGRRLDRSGPRALLCIATVFGAAGFFLVALAHSTWLLSIGFAISSLGASIVFSGLGLAILAAWFKKKRGLAIAMFNASGGIGRALSSAVSFGWKERTVGGLQPL